MSATKDFMEKLHVAVAESLTEKIKNKEATASDVSNAIKFLKDNGIEAQSTPDSAVQSLAASMPTFDDDEENTSLN